MYLDGYKYWFAFKKEDKSYYRCRRFRNGCPGKLWITGGCNVGNTEWGRLIAIPGAILEFTGVSPRAK